MSLYGAIAFLARKMESLPRETSSPKRRLLYGYCFSMLTFYLEICFVLSVRQNIPPIFSLHIIVYKYHITSILFSVYKYHWSFSVFFSSACGRLLSEKEV